jgi:hypothetical protein
VFRLFVPEAVFPVTYRRGRTAHLDLTPDRARAISQALRDQLGLQVRAIEPFGLAGSGGSTPLRIRCAGDPGRYVFGKLYARSHLRADRWYKAGRTILYGTLEDEVRFESPGTRESRNTHGAGSSSGCRGQPSVRCRCGPRPRADPGALSGPAAPSGGSQKATVLAAVDLGPAT